MNPIEALHNFNPALADGLSWLAVLGLLFGLFRSMVLSASDRKRAGTEADVAQFKRLGDEIERLTERVTTLEKAGEKKDTTIAELMRLKLELLAERAAERVLATALAAEKDAIISGLRARLEAGPSTLVVATEHVAEATGRVADAAEKAVKGNDGK